ncbi:nitrilase-related carbon-nitrogen hydrolase [Corallococcus llansteffanensis]|nr:nitrilase-related carbon-nitrogen hydrolase [Corallococcus llansteffanensis]
MKRNRVVAVACLVAAFLGVWPTSASAVAVKVALVHSNPELGNAPANVATLNTLVAEAFANGAKIIVTPELATTGFSITQQQVIDGLGFTAPYPELSQIRDLAIQHQGYVAVAIAEKTLDGKIYNTAVIFGPTGVVQTQQKRGLSGWHDRGVLPFDVITTPYGELATMICSDSYLPDWIRIATLKGADIVLLPSNWWGSGMETIWQTRARENGVWFLAANRWGTEVDTRYGFPYTYYMNDAPSAVIKPNGQITLIHRAEDDAVPQTRILYSTVNVEPSRIGTAFNPAYSVSQRRPEAYGEIANNYYRRDIEYVEAPGLPPTGTTRVATLAFRPVLNAQTNVQKIRQLYATQAPGAEVVVLPGLGVSLAPVNTHTSGWRAAEPWLSLQQFVNEKSISLLVTTIHERVPGSPQLRESLLLVRSGAQAQVKPQIHNSLTALGSGAEPVVLDLPHSRVGILTGRDALFPETGTHLAKSGIDLLLISSSVGVNTVLEGSFAASYLWDVAALRNLWTTRNNEVFHVAASDWTGNGVLIENGGGYISRMEELDASVPAGSLDLDSSFVRLKFLNSYYAFDLASLLGN